MVKKSLEFESFVIVYYVIFAIKNRALGCPIFVLL